jgi:signal transduction histidine kinase
MFETEEWFKLIKSVIFISSSNLSCFEKIDRILQSLSDSFASEACRFFRVEEIKEGSILYRILKTKKPFFSDELTPIEYEEFLKEEKILIQPFFVCIPVYDDSSFYGILYLGYTKSKIFSSEAIEILSLVSKEIGRILNIERLIEKKERYLSELGALYEIGKAVTSTIKLNELINLILITGQKLLRAKGGVLRIKDDTSGELNIKYISGDFNQNLLEERISKRVFSMKTPQWVHHRSEGKPSLSMMCVPLMGSNGLVMGTLTFFDLDNESNFEQRDFQLLVSMAEYVSRALENAYLYKGLEELNQRLKEAQNLLLHREKINALEELSNSIAHEIKNPLTSIGGFARRLSRLLSEGEAEKRYVETIINEVNRLEKILNDVLRYTNQGSPILKECDIVGILKESVSMVSFGNNTNGVQIIEEFEGSLPKINGDREQLKHAFFHLIQNAYQAMEGKGTIFLRVSSFRLNGTSSIRVEVKDTGKGIDPENLHNIFNPFYTNKTSSLGLGLPIVHKIITSHHGQIEVENQPGKGANFIITLPAL